jgi:K+-transporting ATPase ATPase C chain
MINQIRPALVMTALMTLLLGLAYPLAMTGVAKAAFSRQAEGSMLRDASGRVVGSALIAQAFTRAEYLHPRPSAAGSGYDASASSGSNLGPLDPKLADRMKTDAAALRQDAPTAVIPADAVTTSGSGLDPDVSPANARMQAARVAKARGAPTSAVLAIIDTAVQPRTLGFIGEPRVNVLAVNRALDLRYPRAAPRG